MRKILTLILYACLLTAGLAQNGTRIFYLKDAPFNLNYDNRSKLISEMYAPGQDTVAWRWAWTSQKRRGMTYAQFRTLTYPTVCLLEATWWGNDTPNMVKYWLNAYNMAYMAAGKYTINTNVMMPRGGLIGVNSFGNYDQPDPNYRGYATTELIADDARWVDVAGEERHLLDSPNALLPGSENHGYCEGFEVRNLRVIGPYNFSDTRVRVGVFLRRLGSTSRVDNMHVDGWYDGMVFQGGCTPTVGVVCPFDNERCGVGVIGGALSSGNIALIEGDRNGENFGMHPGYGEASGGVWPVKQIKVEDGGSGTGPTVSPNQVWRGTLAMYLEGQYTVTVDAINTSYTHINIDCPIIVNPTIPAYGQQSSLLTVLGGVGVGYKNICHDILHKTYLTSEGNYKSYAFRHWGDGTFKSDRLPDFIQVKSTNCDKPLGFVVGTDGTFSHTTCTPVRNNDPSVPPTCSWTPGAETCAPCVGTTQTCTTPYVTSVAGCTPGGSRPADVVRTQACGTPPPTGNTIAVTVERVSGTNPGGRELPAYAIDGNASTVWSNGARQDAGDAFIQFDAGSEVTWTSATFSAGWASDYARTPVVYVGNSATSTTTTAATITGTSTMTVTFATPVKGRYFRLAAKKTNGVSNWFTVGEAKFYRP